MKPTLRKVMVNWGLINIILSLIVNLTHIILIIIITWEGPFCFSTMSSQQCHHPHHYYIRPLHHHRPHHPHHPHHPYHHPRHHHLRSASLLFQSAQLNPTRFLPPPLETLQAVAFGEDFERRSKLFGGGGGESPGSWSNTPACHWSSWCPSHTLWTHPPHFPSLPRVAWGRCGLYSWWVFLQLSELQDNWTWLGCCAELLVSICFVLGEKQQTLWP